MHGTDHAALLTRARRLGAAASDGDTERLGREIDTLVHALRVHVDEARGALTHGSYHAADTIRQGQAQLNATLVALMARCDQADLRGCARLVSRFEALLALQIAREQRSLVGQ